jgi:glycosyltransferase involved in cell wall biosynthesis
LKLVVFSHKECWTSKESPTGWATDGGFAMHMNSLAQLFDSITLVVPQVKPKESISVSFIESNIRVVGLKEWVNPAHAFLVKCVIPFWYLWYLPLFIKQIVKNDAVHLPIPGHIGILPFFICLAINKKLFIRHCGNWLKPMSKVDKWMKVLLEKTAGGNRVYWATGGGTQGPSVNQAIEWIFSSSLTSEQLSHSNVPKIWPQPTLNLIHIGRQEKEKGAVFMIESMPLILKNFPNCHLTVVGNGNYLDNLKQKVSELTLDNTVSFTGPLPHPKVLDLLKQSTLFCFPTKSSEGFPKVVLEAMSCGLPVISTPVSVLQYLIPESGAGRVLENTEPSTISNTIKTLLTTPGMYTNMSASGIQASKKYSLEAWKETLRKKLEMSWGCSLKSKTREL